jgi:hypothetical protein
MPHLKSSVSLKVIAAAASTLAGSLACGGPGTVDPQPTQNVEAYFAGTDATGNLHVHVHFKQTGKNLTQIDPCVPADDCRIYPYTPTGQTELGSNFPVDLASGTGTFTDPGITFTVTTTNGRTFSFTGTVIQSIQMKGTISGPTHPASALQLDKQ